MTEKDYKEIKDCILKNEKDGRLVFSTIEGFSSADIKEFIKQPTDGILYDLSKTRAGSLARIRDGDKNGVNNFATALVIIELKKQIEELEVMICR